MTWTLKIYNVDGEKAAEITKTEADGSGFQIKEFPTEKRPADGIAAAKLNEELYSGQEKGGLYGEQGPLDVRISIVNGAIGLSPKEHLEIVRDLPTNSHSLEDYADVGSVELVDE